MIINPLGFKRHRLWYSFAGETLLLLIALILLSLINLPLAHSQEIASTDTWTASGGIWADTTESNIQARGERLIVPDKFRAVSLDLIALKTLLASVPKEEDAVWNRYSMVILQLPLPDGSMGRFQIAESPVMAPELAAKFPEIKTYSGQGLDDITATVRIDVTPQGFHAMILSSTGRVFIDPFSRGDATNYISYYTRDHIAPATERLPELPLVDPNGVQRQEIQRLIDSGLERASGTQLRTYRLAVAATGEYVAFHGGTVNAGLAAIVTVANRLTGIYETELAIRLQLVANNDLLIYINAAADPYTNNNGITLLDENIANINAVIGSTNYDIGHVFSTGGGGVAYLGATCGDLKAGGVTGSPQPIGDAFWVDYVAHEMGHQFGGNHTFNSVTGSCGGGNRNSSTAYEPGSASTIMGYAGICGADDLQSNSDAYFHAVSFDEIVAYTTIGDGNTCPTTTFSGNNPPVPNAGTGGFTIPANTPFTLTGSATDPDGDTATYNWEEYDLGQAGPPGSATNPPFFRSWLASESTSRTFPRLSDLLNNSMTLGEVLPNTTRALNFRLTARDNRGGVNVAALSFNVTTAAGPFRVTSPNTAVSWPVGSTQTVTWNVANTNMAPVNCPNVGILLSTDGGLTFPTTLVASTPNDGSATVILPGTTTTTARIKVYSANNIFFDISNTNFSIATTAYTLSGTVHSGSTTGPVLAGATVSIAGKTAISSSTGTFSITGITGGTYALTVSKAGYNTYSNSAYSVNSNQSGLNFYLTLQSGLNVTSPNGGESWQVGTAKTIRWAYTGSPGSYVKIELYKGGVFNRTITSSTLTSTGSYNWNIPSTQTTGTDYKVKVTSTSNSAYYDYSNNNFTIATTYSISGQVTGGGAGISWVTMTLSGGVSKSTSTDSSGNYSFTGLANGSYTVTPSKSGDSFTPGNQSITISGSNQTGVNFKAYPVITSISPTSRAGGTFNLTINGRYFTSGTDDQIYWKADMHFVGSGGTVSSGTTRLVSSENITNIGTYVVKVKNPDGLESNGKDLAITSLTPTLLINGDTSSSKGVEPSPLDGYQGTSIPISSPKYAFSC